MPPRRVPVRRGIPGALKLPVELRVRPRSYLELCGRSLPSPLATLAASPWSGRGIRIAWRSFSAPLPDQGEAGPSAGRVRVGFLCQWANIAPSDPSTVTQNKRRRIGARPIARARDAALRALFGRVCRGSP